MNPNKQKPIVFSNKCGCIVNVTELSNAMIFFKNTPTIKAKRSIYLHGRYPAVTLNKRKVHVHRLLMTYWERRTLETSEHVDHINQNRLDARRENLRVLDAAEHMSYHGKGKMLTDEHKRKISQVNKKRKGIKLKRKHNIPIEELSVFLNKGVSINKIAKHYGCDWSTVKRNIDEHPELLNQKP